MKKKQAIISNVNIRLNKIIFFLSFVILTLAFSCIPVMAEETEEESVITVTPGRGGDLPEDLPIKIYQNSDGISTCSELPESVNLSTSKYFPEIGNQQGNSCTAWATTYYQFTYQVAKLNNWDAKKDNSKVFSPKYIWNYLNGGSNKGTNREESYKILQSQGALRLTEFPPDDEELSFDWYRGSNETEIKALRNALKTRISKYYYYNFASIDDNNPTPITCNKDTDLNHMKTLLNNGYVLSVSTDCKNWNFEKCVNKEQCIISGERTDGAHALTIVGYNDAIECDWNKNGITEDYEKGAFLVANSWGTDAEKHNNGYVWLMYDALNEKSASGDKRLNTANRHRFIRANRYWYIEVENYTPQRMVEVTLEQQCRNDIEVTLANSNSLMEQKLEHKTFLEGLGGELGFDGEKNSKQTCTFVFDYDTLYKEDGKVYWVNIIDKKPKNGINTKIKKIRWIDGNGKVLKMVEPESEVDGDTRTYYYGIPVKNITLNKTNSALYKGESELLTATVSPSNATEKNITWKSSNTSVVKVDGNGKVTCVGTGTAIVTATAKDGSGVSASCMYQITDDYSNTTNRAFVVDLHTKTQGIINRSGDVDCFQFAPESTGDYLIYTTGSINTMGDLYDEWGNCLIQSNNKSLLGGNFVLQYRLEAGKIYYIQVKGNGTNTGAYTLNISKDFYSASIPYFNQDARRVQMQAEAATVLKTLKLTIGDKTYTLNRPANGDLDTTINGARFQVTFEENNNGLSTIWKIEARIPATTSEGVKVSVDFSNGNIENLKSHDLGRLVAYDSAIKTGVDTRAQDSLRKLLTAMQQSGNTLAVYNGNNTLVNVTSTTKAATGMKIIERDRNNCIIKIYYLVVFGDIIGGTVNIGDGLVNSNDSLEVLKNDVKIDQLGALAQLAADVDHDGRVTSADALLINKYDVRLEEINQNYTITTVPDDCYYDTPVTFNK